MRSVFSIPASAGCPCFERSGGSYHTKICSMARTLGMPRMGTSLMRRSKKRAIAITCFLVSEFAKAIVVACNTATGQASCAEYDVEVQSVPPALLSLTNSKVRDPCVGSVALQARAQHRPPQY